MNVKMKIIDSLKKLKNDYGVVAIKAEFEAEGSRKDELIMLRDFVGIVNLGFIIKIGGCEAVHDLDQCKLLSATGVMAPMIETPYALRKYRGAVKRIFGEKVQIECIINAETDTCRTNFDEILEEGRGFLTGVTVGRSDLSGSMGLSRNDIESEPVYEATLELCQKAKKQNLITNFGGNIGLESIPFIIRMCHSIDRFETRKVVLSKSSNTDFLKKALMQALQFELLYLNFKSDYYNQMANEDAARIARLQRQLQLI